MRFHKLLVGLMLAGLTLLALGGCASYDPEHLIGLGIAAGTGNIASGILEGSLAIGGIPPDALGSGSGTGTASGNDLGSIRTLTEDRAKGLRTGICDPRCPTEPAR
jgi:hypothetical protein